MTLPFTHVKHGLTAKHIVIDPGDKEEFAELHDSLLAQLSPEGPDAVLPLATEGPDDDTPLPELVSIAALTKTKPCRILIGCGYNDRSTRIMAAPGDQLARDLLRTFILRTNPYLPFRFWNRWPYSLAVRAAKAELSSQPEIRSLYLRHGMVTGSWIPGLSDIDLSVILKSPLPDEQEFAVVDSLRVRYRRLKRFFPMLGELEILSEDDLPAWLYWTSDSPQARAWTLLHGQPNADVTSAGSPIWPLRALNLALWVYLELLPPCACKPDSFLRHQDAGRRVRKIVRLLNPILREHGRSAFDPEPRADVPSLIARAAAALANAVACLHPPIDNRCSFQPASVPGFAGVSSGIDRRGHVVLVMNDDLGAADIARVAELARERWIGPAVLLPENVFRYFVRHYNPHEYSKLLRNRNILFGAYPLDGVPPPGHAEFAASTLAWADHILAFTRGEELFTSSDTQFIVDLEIEARRMMALQLLLEDDSTSPDHYEMETRWGSRFPESAQALERIKLDAAAGRLEAARRAAFGLFRSFAAETREAMAARK